MSKDLYMKPIKEWFDTLPEPIRSQALKNHYDFWYRGSNEHLNFKESSLRNALIVSFPFTNTPEGYDYWVFISNIKRSF